MDQEMISVREQFSEEGFPLKKDISLEIKPLNISNCIEEANKEKTDINIEMKNIQNNNNMLDNIHNQSINSSEYQSARSHLFSKSQTISLTHYTGENENNISHSSEDYSETKELFKKMKQLIDNKEFETVKELDLQITMDEIKERKMKHDDKLNMLEELEKTMAQKKCVNENENLNEDKGLFLANIKKGDGYYILTKEELLKDFKQEEFKKFEYYVKK
jgi:hypothetical protein